MRKALESSTRISAEYSALCFVRWWFYISNNFLDFVFAAREHLSDQPSEPVGTSFLRSKLKFGVDSWPGGSEHKVVEDKYLNKFLTFAEIKLKKIIIIIIIMWLSNLSWV